MFVMLVVVCGCASGAVFKVDLKFAARFIRPVSAIVGKLVCLLCTVVNVCPL